jgi:hypothetical protein
VSGSGAGQWETLHAVARRIPCSLGQNQPRIRTQNWIKLGCSVSFNLTLYDHEKNASFLQFALTSLAMVIASACFTVFMRFSHGFVGWLGLFDCSAQRN